MSPTKGNGLTADNSQPAKTLTIDAASVDAAEKKGNTEKLFATLRAQYAMRGHSLHRTDPSDGAVTYWAERWGLVRYLPTIDTVRQFLEQIGGRL